MARHRMTAALAALGFALAAPAGAAEPGMIVVQGSGIVETSPDQAEVLFGVETRAATPAEAIDANAAAMERVIAEAVKAGVDRKDIRTAVLSLTNYEETRTKRYLAANIARVQVRDLARLGTILRDLVGSGANELRGVRFSVAKPAPYFDQARRQAVEDAKKRAETLAEAAGQRLGAIVEMTDQTWNDPGVVAEARAMQRANVPVESGQIAMRASVQVKWRIAP
jgi:uncharacterized protein YggE